jgi:hypothetical protein
LIVPFIKKQTTGEMHQGKSTHHPVISFNVPHFNELAHLWM